MPIKVTHVAETTKMLFRNNKLVAVTGKRSVL